MILREMPPLADERFRSWFYTHWGRENCIIAAQSRSAEYPLYQQTLSIKAAWAGQEQYFVDGRRLAVDDDTFIILNHGRSYASRLASRTPVTSFSIFFRPGMAEDVARSVALPEESLLETADAKSSPLEFSEQLRRHDRQITPILRFIYRHVQMGVTDESWYEEQLYFLLRRMIALRDGDRRAQETIPATRRSTRQELFRRVGLGVDFINMHFAEPIGLKEIAAASLLAPYHCLRVFKSVYGKTPTAYLNDRRVQAAQRVLGSSTFSVDDVAALVGFQSRTTLYRQMKRVTGSNPSALRKAAARAG